MVRICQANSGMKRGCSGEELGSYNSSRREFSMLRNLHIILAHIANRLPMGWQG